MSLKKILYLSFLALLILTPLKAELETTVEISSLFFLTRDVQLAPVLGFYNTGSLFFEAIENPHIKAGLELIGTWTDTFISLPADILKRLYLKIDFKGFYLLIGKTRLSFGDGLVFNAGDVLFGSLEPQFKPTNLSNYDKTDWLISLNLPLAAFSFFEAVFLPFSPLYSEPVNFISFQQTRVGGRLVLEIFGLKTEIGYLCRFDNEIHLPYFSLNTNLFFDFYFGASLKIPFNGFQIEEYSESLALSAGLFRLFNFESGSSLAFRLESACLPLARWDGTFPQTLFVYSEIIYSPFSDLSAQLNLILSPLDLSGVIKTGASFGIYQGLYLRLLAWIMFGNGQNTFFGFMRPGDLGISLGFNYIY